MKTCSKCKVDKPFSSFYKKTKSRDGYDSWCKDCYSDLRSETQRESYLTDAERSIHVTASQLRDAVHGCKKRAKAKSVEFDLDKRQVLKLLHDFCENNYHVWEPKHPFRPSIDRVDSRKGYTVDNVKVIWLIENYCKNIYSDDQVLEFCKRKLNI